MSLHTADGTIVNPKSLPAFGRGKKADAQRAAVLAPLREVLGYLPPKNREFFNLEQRARLK